MDEEESPSSYPCGRSRNPIRPPNGDHRGRNGSEPTIFEGVENSLDENAASAPSVPSVMGDSVLMAMLDSSSPVAQYPTLTALVGPLAVDHQRSLNLSMAIDAVLAVLEESDDQQQTPSYQ